MKSIILLAGMSISLQGFAIINGSPLSVSTYAAVGSLYINDQQSCTVTLINSKWIVTADHCAYATEDNGEEGGGEPLPPSSYEIRFGFNSKKPVFKTVLKRWVHGPLNGEEPLDMAFGELKNQVPASLNITPIPIGSVIAGSAITVGYGNRTFFDDGLHPLRFKRQMGNMQIKSNSGNALLNLFGNESNLISYIKNFQRDIDLEEESTEQLLHGAALVASYQVHAWDNRGRENLNAITIPEKGWQDTCFGDSGGPLLQIINKKLIIVGVTSKGLNRTCATMGTVFTVFGPRLLKIAKGLK